MVNGEKAEAFIHHLPFTIDFFFVDLLNKFGADARQERMPATAALLWRWLN
jgi:hypothetical protein